jgi:hypothetical protein
VGRNLTAYGGLLPIATMMERLGFQDLVEETLTIKRQTRAMPVYQFVLAMVLALYIGFSRLNHLRFLEREPMLTGILKVLRLPGQSTFRELVPLPDRTAQARRGTKTNAGRLDALELWRDSGTDAISCRGVIR